MGRKQRKWQTPGNWSDTTSATPGPPVSGDTAQIGDTGYTISSNGTAVTGGLLSFGGSSTQTLTGLLLTLSGVQYQSFGIATLVDQDSGTVTIDGGNGRTTIDGHAGFAAILGGMLQVQAGATVTADNTTIAALSGGTATLLLTGSGTVWHDIAPSGGGQGGMSIGDNGAAGTLTVTSGAALTDDSFANIGDGGTGVATVGNHGVWRVGQGVIVGDNTGESGTLNITTGGTLTTDTAGTDYGDIVGDNGASGGTLAATGTVVVDGAGSLWSSGSNLTIGNQGTGAVTVQNDGSIGISGQIVVGGYGTGSNGSGPSTGNGTLTIQSGGTVTTAGQNNAKQINNTYNNIGAGQGSTGTLIVTGTDASLHASLLSLAGILTIGNFGTGTVHISAGGTVETTGTVLNNGTQSASSDEIGGYGNNGTGGGTGTLTIDGLGSAWKSGAGLTIGGGGNASVSVTNHGLLSAKGPFDVVGQNAGVTGTVTVDNATWTEAGSLNIGQSGTGAVTIQNNGSLSVGTDFLLGSFTGSYSSTGQGTLLIQSGGTVTTGGGVSDVGGNQGSSGTLTVTGAASLLNITGGLDIAASGTGVASVLNGGRIVTSGTQISNGQTLTFGDIIGQGTSTHGTLTLDGLGSSYTEGGGLTVGQGGTAVVTVADGAALTTNGQYGSTVGANVGASGTVTLGGTLAGSGGTWSDSGSLQIGAQGAGFVTVRNASSLGIGGALTLGGYNNSNGVNLGSTGNGTLTIQSGGTVATQAVNNGGFGNIGGGTGSRGTVTVGDPTADATTALLSIAGALNIGDLGTGILTVQNGGTVTTTGTTIFNGTTFTSTFDAIGSRVGGSGTLTVTGPGAEWVSGKGLNIGQAGSGTLSVSNGGQIETLGTSVNDIVGGSAGGSGTVTIDGTHGAGTIAAGWTDSGGLIIGNQGAGSVTVQNGGTVSVGTAFTIGGYNGTLASAGTGTLTIQSGATVSVLGNNNSLYNQVGGGLDSDGTLTVTGAGSLLNINVGGLTVGDQGAGILTVQSAGIVQDAGILTIGNAVTGRGTLTIATATVTAGGVLTVGGLGQGLLSVNSGGTLSDPGQSAIIGQGAGSGGTVTVSGSSSLWTTGSGTLTVGSSGEGVLSIAGQGTVVSGAGFVGGSSGGVGSVTVSGALADWTNTLLQVGVSGTGTVAVNGGTITTNSNATSLSQIGGNTSGNGTVSVTNGGTWMLGSAANLDVGNNGTGTLTVNGAMGAASKVSVSGNGSSSGSVVLGASATGSGNVAVGAYGTLMVSDTSLSSTAIEVGNLGYGALTVSGIGALVTAGTNALRIGGSSASAAGAAGVGAVTVSNGGSLVSGTSNASSSAALYVGRVGTGSLTVTGQGSGATISGTANFGRAGTGYLTVANLATLTAGDGNLTNGTVQGGVTIGRGGGNGPFYYGGTATATIIGGGYFNTLGNLIVGGEGSTGSLSIGGTGISNAVTVHSEAEADASLLIGQTTTITASVASPATVYSAGNTTTLTANTVFAGAGTVTVGAGGLLRTDSNTSFSNDIGISIGDGAGSSGALNVTGAGAAVADTGELEVGTAGLGTLNINSGGVVTANLVSGGIGPAIAVGVSALAAGSSVNVVGGGSSLITAGQMIVGDGGSGYLNVTNGATVTVGSLDIGNAAGAVGNVMISDAHSSLIVNGSLSVGDLGTGGLSILNGADVTITGDLNIGQTAGGAGNVDINDPGGTVTIDGNINYGAGGGEAVLTVGPSTVVKVLGGVTGLGRSVLVPYSSFDPTFSGGANGTIPATQIQTYTAYAANQKQTLASGITYTLNTPVLSGTNQWTIGGTNPTPTPTTLVLNADTLSSTSSVTFGDQAGTLDIGYDQLATISTPSSGTGPFNFGVPNPNYGLPLIEGFKGTIKGYTTGDAIVVETPTAATFSYVANSKTITVNPVGGGMPLGTLVFDNAPDASQAFSDAAIFNNVVIPNPPCFLAGTRIATERGDVPVEALRIGDRCVRADGGARPVVWIGDRKLDAERHPRPEAILPVRVRAGAFGPRIPARDLLLSPDHSVSFGGVLIPVKYLIDGKSVLIDKKRTKPHYFHIELDRHDVILAEGLAVESYLESGDRGWFANAPGPVALHPDFAVRAWEANACAPLAVCGPAVDAARAALAASRPDALPRANEKTATAA